jgi:XTP/dITP diphosphohydrolase
MKIVFATHNQNKIKEVKSILSCDFLTLNDLPTMPDIEEVGETFAENAILKAKGVSYWSRMPAFADDSGLEVKALNGMPGVYSARYGGVDLLLENLKGVKDREARFVCVVAYVENDKVELFEGSCCGLITENKMGTNGFAFDPVFYVEEYGKTFAELLNNEKHKISHRGKAFRLFGERLKIGGSLNK